MCHLNIWNNNFMNLNSSAFLSQKSVHITSPTHNSIFNFFFRDFCMLPLWFDSGLMMQYKKESSSTGLDRLAFVSLSVLVQVSIWFSWHKWYSNVTNLISNALKPSFNFVHSYLVIICLFGLTTVQALSYTLLLSLLKRITPCAPHQWIQ